MKDGRKHAALRRAARIAEGKIDFHYVSESLEDLTVGRDVKTFQMVRNAVDFRRHAGGAGDLDDRPIRKTRSQHLVVKEKTACTGRWHV